MHHLGILYIPIFNHKTLATPIFLPTIRSIIPFIKLCVIECSYVWKIWSLYDARNIKPHENPNEFLEANEKIIVVRSGAEKFPFFTHTSNSYKKFDVDSTANFLCFYKPHQNPLVV